MTCLFHRSNFVVEKSDFCIQRKCQEISGENSMTAINSIIANTHFDAQGDLVVNEPNINILTLTEVVLFLVYHTFYLDRYVTNDT